MTKKIKIGGHTLEFHDKPKHKSVQEVQNLMVTWLLRNINLEEIDIENINQVDLMEALKKQPDVLADFIMFQKTQDVDQVIMLATGLSYQELEDLKDEMFEEDFVKLVDQSRKVVGGDADTFFEPYDLSTTSPPQPQEEAKTKEVQTKQKTQ